MRFATVLCEVGVADSVMGIVTGKLLWDAGWRVDVVAWSNGSAHS
jgi:hypothetical protein